MLVFVTHPNKPGVRAPMRNEEALKAHLADGWVVEENSDDDKKSDLIKKAAEFGIKLDSRKGYAKLLADYESALEKKKDE